jgi:hypothetical protein
MGAVTNYGTGVSPTVVRLGDMNNDGKPDIVTADSLSNFLSVFKGTGSGTFVAPVTAAVGTQPVSVTLADFNQDGRLDAAAAANSINSVWRVAPGVAPWGPRRTGLGPFDHPAPSFIMLQICGSKENA